MNPGKDCREVCGKQVEGWGSGCAAHPSSGDAYQAMGAPRERMMRELGRLTMWKK